MVGDGAARSLDLTGGDPGRLQRLNPDLAERDHIARGRKSFHATAVGFAVLNALRLKHRFLPLGARPLRAQSLAAGPPGAHLPVAQRAPLQAGSSASVLPKAQSAPRALPRPAQLEPAGPPEPVGHAW